MVSKDKKAMIFKVEIFISYIHTLSFAFVLSPFIYT